MVSLVLTELSAQVGGKESFTFLKLPASSHAAALGGNNISIIEDDASMALHNPALLQSVTHRTVSFGYMRYLEGVSNLSAQYVHVVNDKATLSGLAQYLNYGEMKETDVNGNILGNFRASDLALGGTLSYNLGKNLVGGITAKFIYSSIAEYSATAFVADLGINYYDPDKKLSLSAVARNLGGQLSAYIDEYERLPFDLQVGLSKTLESLPVRVSITATDLNHLDYSLFRHLTAGIDLDLGDQVYVAAGYNFRRPKDMAIAEVAADGEEDESSHGAGLSIGAGLKLEKFKLHISYAKYHVAGASMMANMALTF